MTRWPLRSLLLGGVLAVGTSCSSTDAEAPIECGPETGQAPEHLACTGLYADFQARTIAKTARPYAPGTSFWSDGFEKFRWIELPEGKSIDTTVADDWSFPVGTKVWKEFRLVQQPIETRLLWKVADGRWVEAAYVWSEDGKSATRGEGRVLKVAGDAYQIPAVEKCRECHDGKKDALLGFEAISLAQPNTQGVTLATLVAENRLSVPPAKTAITVDPGLAVLHVNCGVSCHNSLAGPRRKDSTLRLRIGVDEAAGKPVDAWELYQTTVGVTSTLPAWRGAPRVSPGAPEKSVLLTAMTGPRGSGQMPPETRQVDFVGAKAVETWIRSLPPK